MTALEFLISLRPAIPMSAERPCTHTSNGELKRWMLNGAVHINGVKAAAGDVITGVDSLVFFPASKQRRTTVI